MPYASVCYILFVFALWCANENSGFLLTELARYVYNIYMSDSSNKSYRGGISVAAAGIFCNVLLSAAKIAVGVIFATVSVVADGFNNLSDCAGGIVALVSLIIAFKPADAKHPYGHRRAEYIASMIMGMLLMLVSVELARESVGKIISGEAARTSAVVYGVLAASIFVKAAMFAVYKVTAKRNGSDALKAAAADSLCDCAATLAVIAGAIMGQFGLRADGFVGAMVALFIFAQGAKILADASSKLLGQAPDKQTEQRVCETIKRAEHVLGVHDLRIYTYGSGMSFATVHVQMDANMPSMEAHAILDRLEREILLAENIHLTTHLDPVVVDDAEAVELQQRVEQAIFDICEGICMHDFRLVRGDIDKIMIDVSVPYSCKLSDADIAERAEQAVCALGNYLPSVTVERK